MLGPLDDSDLDLETIIKIASGVEAEAIAKMADQWSRQWIADGVRTASSQGDPFPAFAAAIRARHSDGH
jgi:hypothetical protein